MYKFNLNMLVLIAIIIPYIYARDISNIFKPSVEAITENPDAGLNIYEYLAKYRYPIETHYIESEDGYILGVHRIPNGRESRDSATNRPVVLLQHGLSSSSMDFVCTGVNRSLALLLADNGYDVWLGNTRGNTWSRQHGSWNPDTDSEFWQFSSEESGYYDLPAVIDHIIEKTGQSKIFYVAHSQGTTQFFIMASMRPEYNEKIALMSALAPVAFNSHIRSPLAKFFFQFAEPLEEMMVDLKIFELVPHSPFLAKILSYMSSDGSQFQAVFSDILFAIVGNDVPQLNRSVLPVIFSNYPAGMSLRTVQHYFQNYQTETFRRYDYGATENLEKYGSILPPSYNISAISAPVALYVGPNDMLAVREDVNKLAKELPNLVKDKTIDYELFNHFDFIWATDSKALLYDELIEYMDTFRV